MEEERRYRTLYGTMAAESKIVAYCRLHKIHLTAQQVRTKRCGQKGCNALKKWDCPYWDRKERMREMKRLKKEQGIPAWEKVEIRTDRNGELLKKLKRKG